jgi:hypothetical protein
LVDDRLLAAGGADGDLPAGFREQGAGETNFTAQSGRMLCAVFESPDTGGRKNLQNTGRREIS